MYNPRRQVGAIHQSGARKNRARVFTRFAPSAIRYVTAQTASAKNLIPATAHQAYPRHACSDDAAADAAAIGSLPSRIEDPGNVLHALSHRGTCWDPFDCLLIYAVKAQSF